MVRAVQWASGHLVRYPVMDKIRTAVVFSFLLTAACHAYQFNQEIFEEKGKLKNILMLTFNWDTTFVPAIAGFMKISLCTFD